MKKTFVILTIVLAMLAAPVFAEVTASGEVSYAWAFNADDYSEAIDSNDMVLNLGGTVGDYTSIKAEFEAEFADDKDVTDGFDTDGDATSRAVSMNKATLTQDVTGAMGIDGAAAVSMTFGVDSFAGTEYQAVAGYGDFEYDAEIDPGTIMTKATIALDMVTICAAIYEDMYIGVDAFGTFGIVDAAATFLMDDVAKTNYVAFNGAASPAEGVTVGAGTEMTMADGADTTGNYGVSAAYAMDALTAGVAFTGSFGDDDADFAVDSGLGVNVNYAVSEMMSVFVGMKSNLEFDSDLMGYEAGAAYTVDSVKYEAGYTMRSDYEAYNPGFKDGADDAGNFYFQVSASF